MKRIAIAGLVVLCTATAAIAQTEGRISVGASVTLVAPSDSDVDSVIGIGPLVRLNPRRGWGVAGALNWFRADLKNPQGGDGEFATLRVRHLMGGVAYTIGPDKLLTSFSIVAGPSFNKIELKDEFLAGNPTDPPSVDVENSFAVRPGVSVTWSVAPRVGIVGFGGYLFNRPDTVFRTFVGNELRNTWKADSVVLSIGAVYSLF
jgi:hypothetical protein